MVFASPFFLFAFLPLSVLVCGIACRTGKTTLRNLLLLVFSLLFYAWGEPIYVLLMIAEILANYFLARLVGKSRIAFWGAVLLDLGALFCFKYLNMFVQGAAWLFRTELPLSEIALPIGISFYTFQILSYVIDVRRVDVPAEESLLDFASYVTMFPQLIAGPIVRYTDIREQLHRSEMSLDEAAAGVRRFCVGLGKKVLIANTLATAADGAFAQAGSLNAASAWLGLLAYALQIYYDFSGYSDMAIGIGQMLGFRFRENFDHPYISSSVREFWRRWHISLSGWFRDYLYIPLGGSRKGKLRTYRNLLIVFVLCGLWHGASWSFVLWGLWHGIFLCIERFPFVKKLTEKIPRFIAKPLGVLYTLTVVLFGWILFRADTLPQAFSYAEGLFAPVGMTPDMILTDPLSWAALAAGVLFCVKFPRPKENLAVQTVSTLIALVLLAASAVSLAGGTYNPFIYFRF